MLATTKLAALIADLDRALHRVSDELELALVDAVRSLSLRYPLREITGCSAMGLYDITATHKGGRSDATTMMGIELKHPVLDNFDRVQSEYGWGAIPAPVLVRARCGVVHVIYDWGVLEPVDWDSLGGDFGLRRAS